MKKILLTTALFATALFADAQHSIGLRVVNQGRKHSTVEIYQNIGRSHLTQAANLKLLKCS